jgi:SAM-dependent methyltransferase
MICRICDSTNLQPALDLGLQPWANHFLRREEIGREKRYPLRLVHCADCSAVQLDYTVPKEVMFADHTYLSGMTRSLDVHFAQVACQADARFFQDKTKKRVLDIGSNDGTQLRHFQKLGYDVLGVESSKSTAQRANAAGVPTLNAFFNLNTASQIDGKFDLINASGVFFHLEELHSVTQAVRRLLDDQGVFIVQFLYMKDILANGAFDQIYHEHLLYYTLRTVQTLLNRHGLKMFRAEHSAIHGGSIIAYAGHADHRRPDTQLLDMTAAEERCGCNDLAAYHGFAQRIARMKQENLAWLDAASKQGKRVFGMGAPVKGNTLLNYFGVGTDRIECLVEKNSLRRGLYSPGMHIPVRIEDELGGWPDAYYVLAWNFKREILERYRELIDRGVEFFFPVDPDRTQHAAFSTRHLRSEAA